MRRKNAFTLIELIVVLVILAIVALIVAPLVFNITNKAELNANKRSVDAYGKAVELSVATYLLDNGEYPTSLDNLTVEYSGNEVVCNTKILNENGSIFLSKCSVKGTRVEDSSTDDGYYHYGKMIYDAYKIGDVVTYNGMNFYVIANSDETDDSVTLLKETPLTVDEVNTYGLGHVNRYTEYSIGTAYDQNGYGGMAYYTSTTCGYPNGSSGSYVETGCTTDYDASEIKYVIDAWATDKLSETDLTEDSLGYKVRLITYDELLDNLGFDGGNYDTASNLYITGNVPSWVHSQKYSYWTMNVYQGDSVWTVRSGAMHGSSPVYSILFSSGDASGVVRPVITLLKSAI